MFVEIMILNESFNCSSEMCHIDAGLHLGENVLITHEICRNCSARTHVCIDLINSGQMIVPFMTGARAPVLLIKVVASDI